MSYAIFLSPIEDESWLVTWTCSLLRMAAIDDLPGHVFRALVDCGMGCLSMQGSDEGVCDVCGCVVCYVWNGLRVSSFACGCVMCTML
jgi:hypothetical protein